MQIALPMNMGWAPSPPETSPPTREQVSSPPETSPRSMELSGSTKIQNIILQLWDRTQNAQERSIALQASCLQGQSHLSGSIAGSMRWDGWRSIASGVAAAAGAVAAATLGAGIAQSVAKAIEVAVPIASQGVGAFLQASQQGLRNEQQQLEHSSSVHRNFEHNLGEQQRKLAILFESSVTRAAVS